MGLYCPGGWNPALLLHTWLGLKLRGSVGTYYLLDRGWTLNKKNGNAACRFPASPVERSPTL